MFSLLFALIARRRCLVVVYVLFLMGPRTAAAQAGLFEFTRVTSGFGIAGSPAIDAGRIAFVGQGPGDADLGIYTGPIGGPYRRVVDAASVAFGDSAPLGYFNVEFGFDAGRLAFSGGQGDSSGIYLYSDDSIKPIAVRNAAIPSTARSFLGLNFAPSIDNGSIAFPAYSDRGLGVSQLRGAYLARDGELSRIADTTMPKPGDDTRNLGPGFAFPTINGGKAAFIAGTSIYLHDLHTGTTTPVVDTTTRIPGHEETFLNYNVLENGLDLDGGKIAFIGGRFVRSGVYVADADSGLVTTIAENGTTLYDAEFWRRGDAFRSVSIDEGRIAFQYSIGDGLLAAGDGSIQIPEFHGVYSDLSGSLEKVVATGDLLEGNFVSRVHMGRQGLDEGQILVEVSFADETEALYVATLVPEPGTLVLLATGCLVFAVIIRLRRRSRIPGIGILACALLVSGAAQCAAAEILWGFEGVITRAANLPSDVEVGSRFGGIIRFTSVPDGNTAYDSGSQTHGWFGEAKGVELSLGAAGVSTLVGWTALCRRVAPKKNLTGLVGRSNASPFG